VRLDPEVRSKSLVRAIADIDVTYSGSQSAATDSVAALTYRPFDLETTVARYFPYLLCGVVLSALVPMLVVAVKRPISLDGFWNVFMDTQDRWSLFVSEYHRDQHPILYRLVLRAVASLGSSRLVYRAASVIPGIATIYLLGLVASRLCLSKTVALLTSAAYGFSATIVDLTCDVRAYPLALLLVVFSFYCFINFLSGSSVRSRRRSSIWFGVLSTAAVATESYSVLFVTSCLVFLLLMSIRYSMFRHDLLWWSRSNGKSFGVVFGSPIVTALAFYFTQARHHMIPRVYLLQFYWSRGESALGFILKNLRLELNYLAPIEIPNAGIIVILVTVAAVATIYFGSAQERTVETSVSAAPGLIAILLISQLIVLALMRRYPFGGEARHQSIVFPFIALAGFVGLDRILASGPIAKYRTGVLAALAVFLAVSSYSRWNQPVDFEEPYSREFASFQLRFPSVRSVYTDQYSLLAYYAHTNSWKWKFTDHLQEAGEAVDEYLITSPSGERVELLRNTDRWNFDPEKPEFYATVRGLVRDGSRDSVTLFLVKQFPNEAGSASSDAIEKTIRTQAAGVQLKVSSMFSSDSATFVTFTAG